MPAATPELDPTALSKSADPTQDLVVPEGASAQQAEYLRLLVTSQVGEQHAKLAALDRQKQKEEQNRAAIAATVQKLTVALPMLRERMEARKYLYEKEIGSKLTYLEVAQDYAEHEQELQVQRHRLSEADNAVAAIVEQRRQAEAEYRRMVLSDLAQADQKARSLSEELVKAEQKRHRQTLTAPVDGVVQQISVHTIGGVVTPAEPVMVLVPAGSRLEIEAMVRNQDIGFVRAGEPAEIKIDTFNFTRYGLLHGSVMSVSEDAMVRDKSQGRGTASAGADDTAARGAGDTSQATGQDLVYTARVSLDRTTMQIKNKLVSLVPGMAVTVEIKTGSRRVIGYLLSPLLRYKQEAMRER